MLSRIDVITLFPEWIESLRELGLTGRALGDGTVSLNCWNPRDYAEGVHRSVDDRPYGGGPGMVMRPEPLARAIEAARGNDPDVRIGCLTPQGRRLEQSDVAALAGRDRLILVCGRYEGIDERVMDSLVDEEWSVGDFVLSGGEPAAAVMIDAVVRLLPGVLGHELSAEQDSFSDGLLDCPHYTRPESWRGQSVPEVLLSGDHARIARWRLARSLDRTRRRRPELLESRSTSAEEERALEEFSERGRDKR